MDFKGIIMKLYQVPIALVLVLVIIDAKFYPLSLYTILSPLLLYGNVLTSFTPTPVIQYFNSKLFLTSVNS